MIGRLCAFFLTIFFVSARTLTLREAGEKRGIFMGSQHNEKYLFDPSDPKYTAILPQQYGLTTAGNVCKWGHTQPQQGMYDFNECNQSLSFAEDNKMAFRAHNLCWGNDNPSWLLAKNYSASELKQFLEAHITTLVAHFGTRPYAWDVVNEAVGTNGGLKNAAPWYPTLPNYVDIAFRAARKAEPTGKVKLFYNDYGAEGLNTKSDYIYAMVKDMLARGVPIDGVGLQMHISTDSAPPLADLKANIGRLTALGLEVHITEMDVKCYDCNTTAGLAKEAQVYANVLTACLSQPKCKSFETWGFTDKHTWLSTDGRPCASKDCYPLPFNANYLPKPAVAAMLEVLQQTN